MSDPHDPTACRATLAGRLLRAAGSVWLGVGLLGGLVAYLSLVSMAPQQAGDVLGASPRHLYGHWSALALWAALGGNLLAATIARVPRRLSSLGAYLAHLGVLVLAAGGLWYAAAAVAGFGVSVRTDDGWSPVDRFYVAEEQAVYLWAPDGAGGSDDSKQVRLPSGADEAMDVTVSRDGGVRLSVVGVRRGVHLTDAAEVRIARADAVDRVSLAPNEPGNYRFDGDGFVVMYGGDVSERMLRELSTAATQPWEGLTFDLVLLATGAEISPTLLVLRPDGSRETHSAWPEQPVVLTLGGAEVTLTALQYGRRPTTAPLAEAATDAAILRAVVDGKPYTTYVAWSQFPDIAPPQRFPLPGRRVADVSFGPPQAPLGGRMSVLEARYETFPASAVPKDYLCRVRTEANGKTNDVTLRLNHPVRVGAYQISQGTWLPEATAPQVLLFSVRTQPGLPLVWTGCGMILAGMLFAFYIKPLLRRRKDRL